MIIRIKKNAKDRSLGPKHRTFSRREFIQRGIYTTTLAAALPHVLAKSMIENAVAGGTSNCPAPSSSPGGIAQIHMPGGGSASASYLLTISQLNMASAGSNAANLWGIAGGSNLVQCFSNGGVDSSSPFGNALLTPPPGISQSTWNAALKQVSYGANYGAAPSDDSAGDNLGHIGAASPIKNSVLNTDIEINPSGIALANWAIGLGAIQKVGTSAQNLQSSSLASGFGISPSSGTTEAIFANTANAATALGNLFAPLFGANRTGGPAALLGASCGFMNDAQMASSTYGTDLFTPANISALSGSAVSLGTLTKQEQAFLAAYYQSNIGQLGAITSVNPGADYHNQSVQDTIAPYDQNIAIQVRMWLLAAMIAGTPSAMIITTNGSPGPNGTQQVTINSVTGAANGSVSVNGPLAEGDDGGSFSAHQLLLYSPNGRTPPDLSSTGTISSNGTTQASSSIASVPASVGGLYFTALTFLGFNTSYFEDVLSNNSITPVSLLPG